MMKKILTMILVLALLAAPGLSAMAERPIAGGWTPADDSTVTPELQALVDQAMESLPEHEFTSVAYLGSQIVAGTNHAVLGRGKAAFLDSIPEWEILFLYENLQGNVTLMNITDFDFGSLCTYGEDDIIAQVPEAGWVRDGVDGAVWQDDRASLEIFLEDVDNFKVLITWASSAFETTEWVYACVYDADAVTLNARYVVCDDVVYNDAGDETRTVIYEKDTSDAVFSLNEEGKIVLTNAGDEALEGKTFEYTGNLDSDAQ